MDIEMDDIMPIIKAWKIIENTLVEAGLHRADAERLSKTIGARLAQNEPPILLAFPDQIRD